VQLRPELATLFATLALYALLLDAGRPQSLRRIGAATLLFAVWANGHAGFPLGLLLLAAATAGLVLASGLRGTELRRRDLARAGRLALALTFGLAATLLNPQGAGALLPWLRAGETTPELTRVADEWMRFAPFRLPVSNLPPTPLCFVLVWGLLALAPAALAVALRRGHRARGGTADADDAVDFARLAWSLASLAALLAAVRFLWLGLFPLLTGAQLARGRLSPRVAAVAAFGLAIGFVRCGDWPMISGLLPTSVVGYAQPYPAAKYYAHALWFLGDAGLRGHVYTDYFMGGFAGFFGAPALQTFVNGSLNVPPEALDAQRAIRARRGQRPGESFEALLDRLGVDLFVGIRLPRTPDPQRPWYYTTAHLEATPGWVCVFRNLDSAVYLRANERNRENFARAAAFYASERVPFSQETGVDVLRTLRERLGFAIAHGMVPANVEALAAAASAGDPELRRAAGAQLGALYAALGLYERAASLERAALRARPDDLDARRRLVWSLLRAGQTENARAEAEPLREAPPGSLVRAIGDAAADAGAAADAAAWRARLATLPLLTPFEASALLSEVVWPEARLQRFGARAP
jgi:hypothetical protein